MSGHTSLKYTKLALVASDQAYFDNSSEYQEQHVRNPKQYPYLHLSKGDVLAPLADVPRDERGHIEDVNYRNGKLPNQTNPKMYRNTPPFAIPPGFKVEDTIVRDQLGAKAVIYRNATTNEIIVAFGGTDGPNAQDHASNSQTYGFSQWAALNKPPDQNNYNKDYLKNPENMGVVAKLDDLKERYGAGEIIFTGQSLGGALAQYATSEYVTQQYKLAKSLGKEYTPSNLHLKTYNALGGKEAFEQNILTDKSLSNDDRRVVRDKLNHLGSATHYVVDNDFVSKLGGGHIGTNGELVMLDWKYLAGPNKGRPMDIADAHRIETAFYTHLDADAHALEKGRVVKEDSSDFKLVHTPNATRWANKVASLGNSRGDMNSDEALYRLVTGLAAGHFAAPQEVNAVVKEVLNTQHRAGMPSAQYHLANAFNDFYNSPGNAKSIAVTIPFMKEKLSLEATTAIAMAGTSIAAWRAESDKKSADKNPDFIDGYRYLPKGESNGVGGIGDGRWYLTPPNPPFDNVWSNPALPSKQVELDATRAFRISKEFKSQTVESVINVAANTEMPPATNSEVHKLLSESQILANVKARRSPDGNEPMGMWIKDSPNQGHSWYQAKDGTVQRVALTTFESGNSLIVTDYAKGSMTPKQELHTIRGTNGEVAAELLIKPNARGQMEAKLINTDQQMQPQIKPLSRQRVSRQDVSPSIIGDDTATMTDGQLAASHAAGLKIAEDIPEKCRNHLQHMVDALIVKNNLTAELNQTSAIAVSALG